MTGAIARAKRRPAGQAGFTLIELLVVIIILGILSPHRAAIDEGIQWSYRNLQISSFVIPADYEFEDIPPSPAPELEECLKTTLTLVVCRTQEFTVVNNITIVSS